MRKELAKNLLFSEQFFEVSAQNDMAFLQEKVDDAEVRYDIDAGLS